MSESFLDGKVTLHRGDCLDVLPLLDENSVDSCVTDPPYGIQFMSRAWDQAANVAFHPATWALVLRVLKPGGHLLAFSGTRTYHRMACAIEDAGFEIRDQIGWCYGSGFPKSHDISKGIDKRGGEYVGWFGPWLQNWRKQNGISQNQINVLFKSKAGSSVKYVANWELGYNIPTPTQFNTICAAFDLPFTSLEEAEREVVGANLNAKSGAGWQNEYVGGRVERSERVLLTAPATEAAIQWQGWGTALKPSFEPLCVGVKPLTPPQYFAIILEYLTFRIEEASEWSGLNVSDVEKSFTALRATLHAEASSVLESARTSVLARFDPALFAGRSFTFREHASLGLTKTKDASAQSNAKPNGKSELASDPITHAGEAEDISTRLMAMSTSVMAGAMSESIVSLWPSFSADLLRAASKFTTETALRLTTGLRILKSLMQPSITADTGSLSPNWDSIVLARKPLSESSIAANVLKHGTGGINIDGTRIPTTEKWDGRDLPDAKDGVTWGGSLNTSSSSSHELGRWPANLILSVPEDEYELRAFTSSEQKRELFRWLSENA